MLKHVFLNGELSKTDDFLGFRQHRLCFGKWAKLAGTTMPTIWSMVMKQVIERTCPQSAAAS